MSSKFNISAAEVVDALVTLLRQVLQENLAQSERLGLGEPHPIDVLDRAWSIVEDTRAVLDLLVKRT